MLIYELGRAILADREREIQERLRQRGWLRDAHDAAVTSGRQVAPAEPQSVGSTGIRRTGVRWFGILARGRPR